MGGKGKGREGRKVEGREGGRMREGGCGRENGGGREGEWRTIKCIYMYVYVSAYNIHTCCLPRLAPLPSSLASGPFYGYRCCLSGLHPPSKFSNVAPPSWSQNAITRFENMVNGDDVVMKVGCGW